MIELTRLDGQTVVVNATHIAICENTPDTLLTLHNGHKMMVEQSVEEVVDKATRWFRAVGHGPVLPSSEHSTVETSTSG